MSRITLPFQVADIAGLARDLERQMAQSPKKPGHLSLMNMLARGAEFANYQAFSASALATPVAMPDMQGNRVWVWVVALKFFDMGFRYRTRRGTPFVPNMFSYFTHGFPNAIALAGYDQGRPSRTLF